MKVCIDPGHGGNDYGAKGKGITEEEIVLRVSKYIRDGLQRCGVAVLMTRTENVMISLIERVKFANVNDCDFFLSIHTNSSSNPIIKGTKAIVLKKGSTAATWGKILCDSIYNILQSENHGLQVGSYYILRETEMPAVMLELFYLSNTMEELKFLEESFQKDVAEEIVKACCKYWDIEYIDTKQERTLIMGETVGNYEILDNIVLKVNPKAMKLGKYYLEIGQLEGVRGEVAFAQAIRDTNFFRYTVKKPKNGYNFTNLPNGKGIIERGYKSPKDAIIAHIQYLKAIASDEDFYLPLKISKLDEVERGKIKAVEDLWKMEVDQDINYSKDIIRLLGKFNSKKESLLGRE